MEGIECKRGLRNREGGREGGRCRAWGEASTDRQPCRRPMEPAAFVEWLRLFQRVSTLWLDTSNAKVVSTHSEWLDECMEVCLLKMLSVSQNERSHKHNMPQWPSWKSWKGKNLATRHWSVWPSWKGTGSSHVGLLAPSEVVDTGLGWMASGSRLLEEEV